MKRSLPLLLLSLVATPVAARQVDIYDSGGPISPEQASFDVTFYDLAITVDPETRTIEGTGTTVARIVNPTATIVLDLDTLLTVSEVVSVQEGNARALTWNRQAGKLRIDLGRTAGAGETVTVRVAYGGAPRVAPYPPWDGGFVWRTTQSGDPWIATANQGEGPDVWWPAKDHVSDKPDSMAIHVTVPEPLVVATNGRLRNVVDNGNGARTYNWFVSTPISAYNVALNIAPYVVLEAEHQSVTGERFPVVFYVLPEDEARGRELLPEILEHLAFFEEYFGPYPFRADKYGVAQTPHLGMEHQTIIAYGANFNPGAMTGGRNWGFDALHHHELAHEWFGNVMTNADWKDMWLHEGFGTYTQALYAERLGGEELYRAYMADQRRGMANRYPVAPRESRTSGQIYFDAGGDIYGKGAWVLHTLRYLIGDNALLLAMRRLVYPDAALERVTNGSHVHFATTDDFQRIAEEISGRDLGWFFEVYVRQPELPRLVAERNGTTLRIGWEVPGGLPFPMPVEVFIDGDIRKAEVPAGGFATMEVPENAAVAVDPNDWILKASTSSNLVPSS
ncbi:MAG TPA: M1 family metallopeptidase [Longimicrobiales bacterium]|nr:M1 family metallopeptidase [Longimicrobiales bacterium]